MLRIWALSLGTPGGLPPSSGGGGASPSFPLPSGFLAQAALVTPGPFCLFSSAGRCMPVQALPGAATAGLKDTRPDCRVTAWLHLLSQMGRGRALAGAGPASPLVPGLLCSSGFHVAASPFSSLCSAHPLMLFSLTAVKVRQGEREGRPDFRQGQGHSASPRSNTLPFLVLEPPAPAGPVAMATARPRGSLIFPSPGDPEPLSSLALRPVPYLSPSPLLAPVFLCPHLSSPYWSSFCPLLSPVSSLPSPGSA